MQVRRRWAGAGSQTRSFTSRSVVLRTISSSSLSLNFFIATISPVSLLRQRNTTPYAPSPTTPRTSYLFIAAAGGCLVGRATKAEVSGRAPPNEPGPRRGQVPAEPSCCTQAPVRSELGQCRSVLHPSTGKHTGACAQQQQRSGERSQGLTHASRALDQPTQRRPHGSARRAPGQPLHPVAVAPTTTPFEQNVSALPAVPREQSWRNFDGRSLPLVNRKRRAALCAACGTPPPPPNSRRRRSRRSPTSSGKSVELALLDKKRNQKGFSTAFFFPKKKTNSQAEHARVADLDRAL
jgi:hypothetical protein